MLIVGENKIPTNSQTCMQITNPSFHALSLAMAVRVLVSTALRMSRLIFTPLSARGWKLVELPCPEVDFIEVLSEQNSKNRTLWL